MRGTRDRGPPAAGAPVAGGRAAQPGDDNQEGAAYSVERAARVFIHHMERLVSRQPMLRGGSTMALAVLLVHVLSVVLANAVGGMLGEAGTLVRFQTPPVAPLNEAMLTIARWIAGLAAGTLTVRAATTGLHLIAAGGGTHAVLSSKEVIIQAIAGLLLISFALTGGGTWLAQLFQLTP